MYAIVSIHVFNFLNLFCIGFCNQKVNIYKRPHIPNAFKIVTDDCPNHIEHV